MQGANPWARGANPYEHTLNRCAHETGTFLERQRAIFPKRKDSDMNNLPQENAKRISQVAEETQALGELVAKLSTTVDDLEIQLMPVLQAAPPDALDPTDEVKTRVPLAGALNEIRGAMHTVNIKVVHIMERLEI